ncbi:NAD-dependent epimerase/dehydratase family protein [Mesobacillus foraminis]|uniref:NAD-dependent epimerase/dehydratase family protein n=1 Tax=Mesobacillus foraminis TaxID=279826 RepID=UPI0039A27A77
MKRVVVTGGAGFIGSHIVEELLQNKFHVSIIDNFSTGKMENIEHLHVDLYTCDITDPSVINLVVSLCPDYIIHQAAQVSVAESVQNPLLDEKINVKGSLHIIEAAAKAKVQKLVFASSAAVYGNPVELPVTTAHPTRPESPYGLTKLTVEHYLKLSSKLNQVPYSILRYSNVYGPRQDAKGEGGVVAIFSDRITNHAAPVIYGDGEQTRDFIYVKDVAAANIKAMLAEENLCVNVSSGTRISVNQLFQAMKEIAWSNLTPVYKEERPGDIRDSVLSNEETCSLLGWEPAYGLFRGLKDTIAHSSAGKKLKIG